MSELTPLPKALWPGISSMYGSGSGGGGGGGYVETFWVNEGGARPAVRCRYCGLKASNDIGHCDGCGAPK